MENISIAKDLFIAAPGGNGDTWTLAIVVNTTESSVLKDLPCVS